MSGRTPIVMWIYGGADYGGSSRHTCNAPYQYRLPHYLYRLAPETRLPDIVADMRDAII